MVLMIFLRLQFLKNNMKRILILSLSLIITSCVDPEDLDFSSGFFCQESPEVESKNGLYYFKNERQPFSGDNICIYKSNGEYAIQGEIKNGLKYGAHIQWYENGQKMMEINYKDGNEDGKGTEWNEDGIISSEAIFKDGDCIKGDCPE